MKKYISKTFLLAVLLSISAWSFGQSDLGYGASSSTLAVTIMAKGVDCPDYGTVESEWLWKKNDEPYNHWISGTSANYSQVPQTVYVSSIFPGFPYYFANKVRVTVIPYGHLEAKNTITVDYPPSSVGITPNNCKNHNYPIPPPNTTE